LHGGLSVGYSSGMTIKGITPEDIEFVMHSEIEVGDILVHAHPILVHIADRPTQRMFNTKRASAHAVVTIDPYIPAPGALNAGRADEIMVTNAGLPTEATSVKSSKVWRVKRNMRANVMIAH